MKFYLLHILYTEVLRLKKYGNKFYKVSVLCGRVIDVAKNDVCFFVFVFCLFVCFLVFF